MWTLPVPAAHGQRQRGNLAEVTHETAPAAPAGFARMALGLCPGDICRKGTDMYRRVTWCLGLITMGACTPPNQTPVPVSDAGSPADVAVVTDVAVTADGAPSVDAATAPIGPSDGQPALPDAAATTLDATSVLHRLAIDPGQGSVESRALAIKCAGPCSYDLPAGTVVTLAASIAQGSFTGWSGDCSGSGTCTVTMDRDRSVTAAFRPFLTWQAKSGPVSQMVSDGTSIYVVGSFTGSAEFGDLTLTSRGGDDAFVSRYDLQGKLLWVKTFGGTGQDVASRAVIAANGDVLVVVATVEKVLQIGTLTLTAGQYEDTYLVRFSASGEAVSGWSSQGALDAVFDSRGNVFIAQANGTPLIKFDGAGKVLWQPPDEAAYRMGFVALDASENIYACGLFERPFPLAPLGKTLTPVGSTDLILLKLTAAGVPIWAATLGARDGLLSCNSLVLDAQGNAGIIGWFTGDLRLGNKSARNVRPGYNEFIARFSAAEGTLLWGRHLLTTGGSNLSIAPEPTGDLWLLSLSDQPLDFGDGVVEGNRLMRLGGGAGAVTTSVPLGLTDYLALTRLGSGDLLAGGYTYLSRLQP
jgi:hypothetical protein